MPPLLSNLIARLRSASWGERGYALIVVASIIVFGMGAINHWRARSYDRMSRRIAAAGARSTRNVSFLANEEDAYFLALLGDFSCVAITGVLGNGPDCTVDAPLLRRLRSYPEISRLRLMQAPLKHEDFQSIYELENLSWLNLAYDSLTDADLVGVEKLQSLDRLELQFTRLTDASIPTLAKLPGISTIDISGTAITVAGANRLRREYRLLQGAQAPTTVIHRPAPTPRFREAVIRLLPTRSYGADRDAGGGLCLLLRVDHWKRHEQDIPWIAELKDVETVSIQGMPLSKPLLDALAKLPLLRQLNIAEASTADCDLSSLSHDPSLRSLRLTGMRVEKRFVAGLANIETLENLEIVNCRLTPGACQAIPNLQGVRSLNLQQVDVDPSEFAKLLLDLEHSPRLHQLDLSHVPIDNECIPRLARLKQLVSLGLASNAIDDGAVPALCRLTHLRQLDISGTAISLPSQVSSQDGATQLETALRPANVRVVHPYSKTSPSPLSLEQLTASAALKPVAPPLPAANGPTAKASKSLEHPAR